MLRTALLLLAGCASPTTPHPASVEPSIGGKADGVTPGLDIERTALEVDVASRSATARMELAESRTGRLTVEAGDLDIHSVRGRNRALPFTREGKLLHVELGDDAIRTLTFEYDFRQHDDFDGLLASGSTNVWPYHCGNLYPCNSSPSDGLRFSLALRGVPRGQQAIFPTAIERNVPTYTLAWAVGDYTCTALGRTRAGTSVEECHLPRGSRDAIAGTRNLVAAFEWYEEHLGPYSFGDRVKTVAARWGSGGAGGMEHHPYWHVAVESMDDPVTHVHEAAHGWFGAGVRIACWEDFVLSEGTVSYLSARAIGAIDGADAEADVWREYTEELETTLRSEDIIAWPDGCGEVDILRDGLFSNIVYMKGAFFFRALSQEIGVETLDGVLASFYRAHRGEAMRMQDLLDHVQAETGFDPTALATHWLRSRGNPF